MGRLQDLFADGGIPPSGREKLAAEIVGTGVERLVGHAVTPYHKDPLLFLNELVYTRDESDETNSVKKWPTSACRKCRAYGMAGQIQCSFCAGPLEELGHVRSLVEQWLLGKPKIMIVPKPRRFLASWLFTTLHAWLAIARREAAVYFQSRTEDDSRLLIDRVEFMLDNIPASKFRVPKTTRYEKPPRLEFENGSQIIGKPEGKNALRGVTATAILLDEIAFWEQARASYEAIKPLVDKGCRLTIISSASPGFFRQLVEGDL